MQAKKSLIVQFRSFYLILISQYMSGTIQPENIQSLGGGVYFVKSESSDNVYEVIDEGATWKCTCPHHIHRRAVCKHIVACKSA